MTMEEKANIDTLLIAAEVLESDLVRVHFQSGEHLFQRDSLIHNSQRRFSAAYAPTLSPNVPSVSGSPSASPSLTSKRHWLTSDLIAPPAALSGQSFTPSPDAPLADLKSVHSTSQQRNSSNNNGSASLVSPSDPESPESWQLRATHSPVGIPTSCPSSTVATQTTTSSSSSSSSCSTSDTANILPLRQLRTALLGERLVGGVKTQRAFSDVSPPWSESNFIAQAADLVHLAFASVVTSPEKVPPRLPAKKRKFDWGERNNGEVSPLVPPLVPSVQPQSQPTSLIVDKPAQLGVDSTRRSSVSSFAEPSRASTVSLFHYPATQHGPSRLETPVKQRKLSYPDLSFTSDTTGSFAPLRPPLPVSAFSVRADAPPRRSSLVVDVNNSNKSSNTSTPTSASSSSSNATPAATANNTGRMRSPPLLPPQSGGRWRGEFPSPPTPNQTVAGPPRLPLQRHPSHHSETGRRYSVFEAPAGLVTALMGQQTTAVTPTERRHSATVPSTVTSAFNTPAPVPYHRQQQQLHQQSPPFLELKSFNRPPIPAKGIQTEELQESYGPVTIGTATRPLSAPEEPVPGAWSSPLKAERPSPRSAVSPLLPSFMENPNAGTRERQRRMSHVPVLGAILSSSPSSNPNHSNTPNPHGSYGQALPYGVGDRKHSLDSLFPITKTRSHGGAVLLTGSVCCPPSEKSFDGGFPLLLVSAPTSASAAEFAAATAVASGAPASSLIPVPVQIVPDSAAGTTTSTSSAAGSETGVALVSKTTNEADQRLVFPLVPTPAPDGQMSGCALGFPLLVPNRLPHCHSPPT